jgi:hypothetical protein
LEVPARLMRLPLASCSAKAQEEALAA